MPKFVADSSVSPTGLKWAVDPVADVVTTAGDLIYGTTADTVARLGIGTAGQVLKVNSGATAPEWGAAGGSSFVGCVITKSVNQALTSATATAVTFDVEDLDTDGFHSTVTNTDRITIPSGKGGKYLIVAQISFTANATNSRSIEIRKNNTGIAGAVLPGADAGSQVSVTTQYIADLAANDYINIYAFQDSGISLNALSTGNGPSFCRLAVTFLGA